MEENREQPVIMPATALNAADDESAMSEAGSQGEDLGKFKSVQALMDAYNNLQAEFTKKCQKLSQLQKDKTDLQLSEKDGEKEFSAEDNLNKNVEKTLKNDEKTLINAENGQKLPENQQQEEYENNASKHSEKDVDKEKNGKESIQEEQLDKFLESNFDAKLYEEEIKKRFPSCVQKDFDPFEVAWAKIILEKLKEGDKLSDPLINQYVLSDENVKNKIIEDYLKSLNESKPPLIISSQSGERLSGVSPASPKTLADAKAMMDKMFS